MTEDFVSFDLAKKLKEKGFRWDCFAYYMPHSDELIYNVKPYKGVTLYSFNSLRKELISADFIDAPTISQVLKWLREKKDIFIELEYINQEAYGCTIIIQKTGGLIAKWDWDKFKYANKNPLVGNTYEEAALAGIEYCLDNLI